MVTTRNTDSRLEDLEKAVGDLTSAVEEFRTFRTATETRNTSMDAKLDALMKKFGISLEIPDPEKLEDSSSSETEQPLSAMPKMDLPGFDGSDALSWLSRAEQYFLVHHIPVAQRVQIALIAMSGSAMSWIQILLRRCPNLTWSQFSKQLLTRFGDGSTVNGYEAFFTTKQTGSLEDYISAFEGHVSQLPEFTDDLYLGAFLGGLTTEIRVLIQDATLTDYTAAIHMAKKVARGHAPSPNPSPSRPALFSQPSIRSPALPQISSPVPSPPQPTPIASSQDSSAPRLGRHIRTMSDDEYRQHLAAGTCFRCGLKYSPTHRCPPKTLQVMVIDPDEDADGDGLALTTAHSTEHAQSEQHDLALARGGTYLDGYG